jgi:K+-sensing histidine kinase KdpD
VTDPKPTDARERHALPPDLIHDLRTPLNQIIGYSELLIEQAEDAGQEESIPQLRKIRAAGYRLLELMNENFLSASPTTDDGASPPTPSSPQTPASRISIC